MTDYKRPAHRVGDAITYLLIGGGIGALLALLFAPKSGSELRGDIADVACRGYDTTLETLGDLRSRSVGVVESVKERVSDVYDFAASKLGAVEEATDDLVSAPAGSVAESIDRMQNESGITGSTAAEVN